METRNERLYKRLILNNNQAVGAILINAPSEQERFYQLIKGEINLSDVEENFTQRQQPQSVGVTVNQPEAEGAENKVSEASDAKE